ncbi:STAS domain-containing protein [Ramlibacter rhizophilus]|uniref:STAS domain-containing protein n=1 Tax=Ramlibacter rhizophilus TaxID=1781167 RepID=A0A4Z0BX75_9BURK|nr:STAS domain-containing protein [Ramlibacter rhizophilus]TFZ03302.1 STAS domain-containing protein [Ramlibacter rhizophilus]
MTGENKALAELLERSHDDVLRGWVQAAGALGGAGSAQAIQAEARDLLQHVLSGLRAGASPESLDGAAWADLRAALEGLSRSRVAQGQTAGDTSAFVLAFKRPLFSTLQQHHGADPKQAMAVLWAGSVLVDQMAQLTVTTYQRTREEVIRRQQHELLELSTPVIKLWDGVLAVPMIGTLDSQRTQLVMEALLQRIVETGAQLAIIDITGVPTVDTLVAQHLLKTVSAIRLMGADCIISGIRPQIAQTIVHLGIDLQGIASKSSLADALAMALQQTGFRITRVAAATAD